MAALEPIPDREVGVVLPTLDAGPGLDDLLERIRGQALQRPPTVTAVDSGSRDGTVETLRRHGARVIQIDRRAFNHGTTRNLGLEACGTPLVAFLSQDAVPLDDQWLPALVEPFADPLVVGTYSRQRPRPGANAFVRERLAGWEAAHGDDRVQRLRPGELASLTPVERLRRGAFDNVSSCVRRDVALDLPFRRCPLAEDLDWSLRAQALGYEIVFAARSQVVHSHDRSLWYELRRAYLDHQCFHRLVGLGAPSSLLSAALGGARHGWRLAAGARSGGRLALLGAATAVGQALGYRSARALAAGSRRWAYLDRCLGRRV